MRWPETLAHFPYVVVRLRCELCPRRRGSYRLARLVERFGADADLDRVRWELARPCPRLKHAGTSMRPACRVEFVGLRYGRQGSPDLPPLGGH